MTWKTFKQALLADKLDLFFLITSAIYVPVIIIVTAQMDNASLAVASALSGLAALLLFVLTLYLVLKRELRTRHGEG